MKPNLGQIEVKKPMPPQLYTADQTNIDTTFISPVWLENVTRAYYPTESRIAELRQADFDMAKLKSDTEDLSRILHQRLAQRVSTKVSEEKRQQYCVLWSRQNITRVARP